MPTFPNPKPPYKTIVVETYIAGKSGHRSDLRVRVTKGQPFPEGLDVSCSNQMRQLYPIGTRFRVHGKLTQRLGGSYFIYTRPAGPYEIVT